MRDAGFKDILRQIYVPLILLGAYLVFVIVWSFFSLPSPDKFLPSIFGFLLKYGLWTVFIAAFIEGFFILGQYFPGGIIIFLGIIAAGEDKGLIVNILIVSMAAFFIAYNLNYLVGRYGLYKILLKFGFKKSLTKVERKLEKNAFLTIFFSYIDSNISSITAVASGVLKYPFKKFMIYSALGIVVWNTLWAVLVYNLGDAALEFAGPKYIIFLFLVWVSVILTKYLFFDVNEENGGQVSKRNV